MPTEIKTNSGAVKTPAGATAPAKITDNLDGGPLTGRKADAVLGQAIENAFLSPAAPETKMEGEAGKPAPVAGAPGGAPAKPANDLPPENAEQKAEREKAEAGELQKRADERGVTVEQLRQAETDEVTRLEEVAARTGESFDEIYAREDKGGAEPAKAPAGYTQEQVDARVKEVVEKRLKTVNEENAGLKRQLAERGAAAPAGDNPLVSVTSLEKLVEVQQHSKAIVKDANALLQRLNYAPRRVENYFRELAAKVPEVAAVFRAADGSEDFGVEKMADVLTGQIEKHSAIVEAAPDRKVFIEAMAKNHQLAMKAHPWLENSEDERTVFFRGIEAGPIGQTLKTMTPTWEYFLGCAATQHLANIAAAKANGNGTPRPTRGGFTPRVSFPRSGDRGGRLPPLRNGDAVARAKERLKATGSEKDLEAVLLHLPGVVDDLR